MRIPITVLMTTYNCARYISQAIKSVLSQTHKDLELLIIDDGSTDNTEEIVSLLQDSRIKFVRKDRSGRSAALNYGLKNASFDTIALMDADDISHPQRLEIQLRNYDFGYASISSTWSLYFKNDDLIYCVKTPISDSLLKKELLLHSYICNPSVVYNRNFIIENDGYNEVLKTFEEYDLWLRIRSKAYFNVVPKFLLFMRIRSDSLSRKHSNINKKIIYKMQKELWGNNNLKESITEFEKQLLKGWQAFFYGTKTEARKAWLSVGPKFIIRPKVIIALLITYVPLGIFLWFREGRLRLRIYFFIEKFFSKQIKEANKIFNELI